LNARVEEDNARICFVRKCVSSIRDGQHLAAGSLRLEGRGGSAATLRQALASPASVFGYESVDDWSSSAMLDSASTTSQGSASLAVNGEGWTEVTSVELGSLGAVKDTASLDVMLPSLASWGEVRLIFKIPSSSARAHWWVSSQACSTR
jgi:hypothetical protein